MARYIVECVNNQHLCNGGYSSIQRVYIMSYSEYRKKLRMLTAKYIEAYKKYGWNAETTRKLRQQKRDFNNKYEAHGYKYSVEILTGKRVS